jgi:zinc protease
MFRKQLFVSALLASLSFVFFAVRLEAQQTETRLTKATEATPPVTSPRPDGKAPLPTPQELLRKSNDAVGGLEAWNKTTSRKMKGVFQTEDSSAFLAIEILQKSPNKSLSKTTFPNGVILREVCDGHSAWLEDSAGGYREFTGAALASKLQHAEFQDRARLEQAASTGKVTGPEKVGTHTAYVLEFSPEQKLHSKLYFDVDSGLIVRSEDAFTTPDGPYTLKLDMDDYREVDGLKFPFRMKRAEKGVILNIRLTQVTVNLPLDDSLFLKPEFAK